MDTTRRLRLLCLVFALLIAPAAYGANLTASAAISLKDALTDAGKRFEQKTGDQLSFNFLSSGALARQIERGAPADLFISAARKQIDELSDKHLIDPATIQVIARGQLVLIAPADEKNPPVSFTDLADPRFARIAIGEPATVPAGDYAMQTLRALKLDGLLAPRLQTAANVRQVLQYVERGEVDAGIVYRSDALAGGDRIRIVAVADPSTHQPIEYPGAVIAESASPAEARRFLDFLRSADEQDALVRLGFDRADQ
jgi:molybdate transport system substrate-binding protein